MQRRNLLVFLVAVALVVAACSTSEDTIETEAEGNFLIDEVQLADRFPPGCDPESAECSQVTSDYALLVVWLEALDPEEVGDFGTAAPHVTTGDGTGVEYVMKGHHQERYFVAFAPPASAEAFTLHWADNEPIDLGKYLQE